MTTEEYEAKRQAKVERFEELAHKAESSAQQLHNQAERMASAIPFGQPILVGHHSEGRDRRYRGRIENKFRKSFQEYDKAEYYKRRAEAAASNRGDFQ